MSCRCLPGWWVKSPNPRVTPSAAFSAQRAHGAGTAWGSTNSHSLTGGPEPCAFPAPRLCAAPQGQTSVAQETSEHIQGAGWKFEVVPILSGPRTPSHWAGNMSVLSLHFYFLHLWVSSECISHIPKITLIILRLSRPLNMVLASSLLPDIIKIICSSSMLAGSWPSGCPSPSFSHLRIGPELHSLL